MTCPTCNHPLRVTKSRGNLGPSFDGNEIECTNPACEYTAWESMREIADEEAQALEARAEAAMDAVV